MSSPSPSSGEERRLEYWRRSVPVERKLRGEMVDGGGMVTLPLTASKEKVTDFGGRERRRSSRKPHIIETWLFSDGRDRPSDHIDVVSINISKHGMGMELEGEIPVGNEYSICIGMGPQRLVSRVKIVSCKSIGKGLFRAGGEFC